MNQLSGIAKVAHRGTAQGEGRGGTAEVKAAEGQPKVKV